MKFGRTLGISLVVALTLLLAVPGTALALVEQLTIDELTAKADSILVGEVTDIACYEEGKGNIYTLVTLSVEQAIKGETEGEVVVKVPGGEVDGLKLSVSDTPSFQLGERTVVFLEEVVSAFKVSGWYQGKFTVVDNRVVERDQSLTNFMADISQAMEAQGITPKLSVKPVSMVLDIPLESKAVEPAKTEEFQVGWENIMTDGFEGTFPGTTWALGGTPTWDKESYRKNSGTYSVWCAGSTLTPPSNYPNNMNAWMVYGPFNLVEATDAELNYYLWYEMSDADDTIFVGASINGSNFYGSSWSGSTSDSWASLELDLTNVFTLGDLTGQSQVWIAFYFESDVSVTDYGAFIDDVVLRKYVSGGTPPQITNISPASGSAGTGFQVTITGTDFGATQDSSTVTFWRGGGYTAPEASIVSWNDTQILCAVPSGASSGNTSNGVRVTTGAGVSNDFAFTVTFSYGLKKWPGTSPMGETFLIKENTADTTGELQAVINAAQAWNDVDGANFSFEYGGTTTVTDYVYNDQNDILWVNYDTGSIATCYTWSVAGVIWENDIIFNDFSYTWDTSGSPTASEFDVQNIAVHELGHCLNLKDLYGTADAAKTMYGFGSTGQTSKRTLEAEDKAGIRWIYANWDSHKIGYPDDSGVQEDNFDDFDTEHIVYMYGTGFNGTYKVIYWDGDGDKRVGEVVSAVGGTLKTNRTFNPGEGIAGDWHAVVYTQDADPSSYSPSDLDIVADDTSYPTGYAFHVDQSAIPEFPTVVAAIVALALSAGVYLWMRRKAARVLA